MSFISNLYTVTVVLKNWWRLEKSLFPLWCHNVLLVAGSDWLRPDVPLSVVLRNCSDWLNWSCEFQRHDVKWHQRARSTGRFMRKSKTFTSLGVLDEQLPSNDWAPSRFLGALNVTHRHSKLLPVYVTNVGKSGCSSSPFTSSAKYDDPAELQWGENDPLSRFLLFRPNTMIQPLCNLNHIVHGLQCARSDACKTNPAKRF